MNFWLIKSEPSEFSWQDLEKVKSECWSGVRNYQARNNLKLMKKGDLAFFYHSQKEKAIVGIAKVVKEFYQDPTTENSNWVAVDVAAHIKLNKVLTLQEIKLDNNLCEIALLKQMRLSVMPISEDHFKYILNEKVCTVNPINRTIF